MSPIADPRFAAQRRALLDKEEADSRRAARLEYIKPLTMLIVGGCVMMGVYANSGGREDLSGATLALLYPVGLAIQLGFGLVGLWLATKVLIDDAGPLHLALLRLAGIYACTDVVGLIVAPLFMLGWLIQGAVYLGMLMWLFELDVTESIVLALITFLLKVGAGIVLMMMIIGS